MQYLRINNRTITTPILDIVKDIKSQIHNGKLATINPRNNDIRVTCPFHKSGHEHKASADIYIGEDESIPYGWFKCFTCGEKVPFYHFVASCFETDDNDAKKWLIENYADGTIEYDIELPPIDLKPLNKKSSFLDEAILDNFQDFHPYMTKRKLSKNIIDLFEIKYDPKTRCLVFPVRDEKGKLIMLTRRSVESKMFIIDKNKEKPLYLLYYMIENNIQEVMITEGQIDALTACGYGFPCIATMGSISDHQIDLLNKSNIRVLYTMFDHDTAGNNFTDRLMQKIRKDIIVINVPILFAGKKDINDLSIEEFDYCIEQAEKRF